MFSILHISDLHRAANEPFSNEEIISSLVADIERYPAERPPLSRPNAIIVSGDIVQGLPLGSAKYPAELATQYRVALGLLQQLTDTFVGGDRSKVLLIPGNHDVDFNQSFASMVEVKVKKSDIKGLLFANDPDNPHRWSWKDAKLYKITDVTGYDARFRYYCEMVNEFYAGATLAYPIDPGAYSNLFELDNGNIVVAAFNSCSGNDCFNNIGDIPPSEIAKCHLKIAQSKKPYRLKLAVWHHDIAGPPKRIDYMDASAVKLMIDRGFRLGLHGHQHKPNAAPESVYTPRRSSMVVISAGSLCAGTYDIPRGVSRAYNLIEIDANYTKARIHVREAKVSNIFAAGRFIDIGGMSYEDVTWVPENDPESLTNESARELPLARVLRIETLLEKGNAAAAVTELDANLPSLGRHGRALMTKALTESRSWDRLVSHLASPESGEEIALLVTGLINQKLWQQAKDLLKTQPATDLLAPAELAHLDHMVLAEEAIANER